MIDPCTTEPGYWQNHVVYILTISASLLLCVKPSAATILSDVKYSVPHLDSRNILPTILCWFYCIHFAMWQIYCQQINASNIVSTKELMYKNSLRNKIVLHVCRPTLNLWICIAQIRQFICLFNILIAHTDFNRQHPTFQAVQGKAGSTLSEETYAEILKDKDIVNYLCALMRTNIWF